MAIKNRKAAKAPFKSTAKSSGGSWWVFFIWIFTFLLSTVFTLAMSDVMRNAELLISIIILIFIILLSIFFDIIGIAVMTADVTPFNSMAARKVYGSKTAITMIKNADRVSNVCNDVIGDILGIISGSITAYIVIKIMENTNLKNISEIYTHALLGGFVAALTVGGKSFGKGVAINNSNSIVYRVAVIIRFIKRK